MGVDQIGDRMGREKYKKRSLRVILKEQKHVCLFNIVWEANRSVVTG